MSRAKVIKVFLILFMLCMISSSGFADQNPINSEEEYEKHIKLAKEYFKEKQWDEAIEEYTNAISLKPDNAYLYYARGLSYYKKSNIDVVGILLGRKFGVKINEDIYVDSSIEDFNKAIELSSTNAVFYFLRGAAYFYKGKDEAAKKDFDKAIMLKPDVSLFYWIRGLFLYAIEDSKGSISDHSKAIELKPDSDEKLYSLFIKPYERFIELDLISLTLLTMSFPPSSLSSVYNGRAGVYEEDGQYEKALKDYTMAIKLEPQNPFYYNSRGDFYLKLKKYGQAIKDYTKAIELSSSKKLESSLAFSNSLPLQVISDSFKKTYKFMVYSPKKLEVSLAVSYYSRGNAYLQINQMQKAKADLEKACSLNFQPACYKLEEIKKAEERGGNWVFFFETDESSSYYDKTRIKTMPNKHIRVWVRREVKNIDSYIESRRKDGLSTKGYGNFSHSLRLWEMDCKSETLGVVSYVDYDSRGGVLDYFNYEKIKLNVIVPNSMGDGLYRTVCQRGGDSEKER